MTHRRSIAAVATVVAVSAACSGAPDAAITRDGEPAAGATAGDGTHVVVRRGAVAGGEAGAGEAEEPAAPPPPAPSPSRVPSAAASDPPDWYRQRLLEVTDTGFPAPQDTPDVYRDRRIVTVDHLPPPPSDEFTATIQPIPDDIVPRSTWQEGCPTSLEELRYLTVSHWGFDALHHTGELIVHRDVADDMVGVFAQLHAARFPMEQVGLLEGEDFQQFHRRGDDNLTAAYECRASTGSSRWSQHAYGRAIDINPFHNPYWKVTGEGEIVLPAYATAYLDRDRGWPGMITEGDVVVEAFDAIGWGWGGRWNTLKDWQHFSENGN